VYPSTATKAMPRPGGRPRPALTKENKRAGVGDKAGHSDVTDGEEQQERSNDEELAPARTACGTGLLALCQVRWPPRCDVLPRRTAARRLQMKQRAIGSSVGHRQPGSRCRPTLANGHVRGRSPVDRR
jgi:hypothetical protein